MAETRIELNEYLKMLFNFNRCGDLIVIGLAILENVDESRPNLTLDTNIVAKSIEFLLKRHPLLRAYIEVDNKHVYFRLTDDPSRVQVVDGYDLVRSELATRGELMGALENLVIKPMDYENKCKLWRAGFFSFRENERLKYALAFFLPLYMTDALNITSLTIELGNLINSVVDGVQCDEMTTQLPVVDSEITLIQKDNLIGEKQIANLDEIKRKLNTGKKFKLDAKFANPLERGSKINIFKLDKQTSKSLISKCKQKGIKFTGFFMSTLFYSIRDFYIEHGLEPPKEIFTGISVNMRFRLKNPVDYSNIGYFSGLIPLQTEFPRFGEYTDIWSDSKYWDQLIKESTDVSTGAIFIDIYDPKLHREINDFFDQTASLVDVCAKMQESSRWDVIVSNIGTYLCSKKQQRPKSPFEIKELYYADSLNARPSRDNSLIYHVGLWNDEMMFMITSDKSRFAPVYADRLISILENKLKSIADESD